MIGLIVQTMLVGRCWKLTKNMFVLVISIVFITAGHVAGIYMVGEVSWFSIPTNMTLVIGSNHVCRDTIRLSPRLGYVFSHMMHRNC